MRTHKLGSSSNVSALLLALVAGGVVSAQPAAPSALTAVGASGGRVVLTWADNSDLETGFEIRRDPAGEDWPVRVGANVRTFTDTPPAGRYVYTVVALSPQGVSEPSEPVRVSARVAPRGMHTGTTQTSSVRGPIQMLAPSNLTLALSGARVDLRWTPSSSAQGYTIVRERAEGGGWVDRAQLRASADASTLIDEPGEGVYRYHVRAVGDGVESAPSRWVVANSSGVKSTADAQDVPSAPKEVVVSVLEGGRVMVGWHHASGGESGFVIERDPPFSGGALRLGGSARAYVDSAGAGTFRYSVKAVNSLGASEATSSPAITIAGSNAGGGSGAPGSGGPSVTESYQGGDPQVGGGSGGAGGGSGGGSGGGGPTGGGGGGGGGGGTDSGAGSTDDQTNVSTGIDSPTQIPPATWGGGDVVPTLPIDSEGWTVLNPSPTARVVFVSSSTGLDSNTGLSESSPKRSIAAAYAMLRSGQGDWIKLKRGDRFTGPINWYISGKSRMEPAVLTAYGVGERPIVESRMGSGFFSDPQGVLNHVAVTGIHFKDTQFAGTSDPNQKIAGVWVLGTGENLLIEDCRFENFSTGICIQGWQGTRVNTVIRRNLILDSYHHALPNNGSVSFFTTSYDGVLLEENVFDVDPAILANDNHLSHNVYMTEDNTSRTIVRGNIARNGGRSNFSVRSGGLIEDNLSIRGAMHFSVGISYATNQVDQAVMRRNVLLESRDNSNGQPLGIGFYLLTTDKTIVEDNIIAHGTDGSDHAAVVARNRMRDVTIRNNVVYQWNDPSPAGEPRVAFVFREEPLGRVEIVGNDVQQNLNSMIIGFDNAPATLVPRLGVRDNRVSSAAAPGMWFQLQSDFLTLPQFAQRVGNSSNVERQVSYVDPNRTISTYMSTVGNRLSNTPVSPTTEAFMMALREQAKGNWRSDLTAPVVNAYIRQGFGK